MLPQRQGATSVVSGSAALPLLPPTRPRSGEQAFPTGDPLLQQHPTVRIFLHTSAQHFFIHLHRIYVHSKRLGHKACTHFQSSYDIHSCSIDDLVKCVFHSLFQVDDAVCNAPGISSLRINGAIHHKMGRLLPSDPHGAAQFAQIYVLDNAEDRLNRRMAIMPDLARNIMKDLSDELQEHNAFARAFLAASVHLATLDATADLMFKIKGASSAVDSRRFNTPVAMEIAAWIPDGAEPIKGCRDIKLFARSGDVKHINELHPAYMSLHFPLLFPYGESGWHTDIPRRDGVSTAASGQQVQDVLAAPSTSQQLFESLDEHSGLGIPSDMFPQPNPAAEHDDDDDEGGVAVDDPDDPMVDEASRERKCTLLRFASYHLRHREHGNFALLQVRQPNIVVMFTLAPMISLRR
jgi:hypothetical protein